MPASSWCECSHCKSLEGLVVQDTQKAYSTEHCSWMLVPCFDKLPCHLNHKCAPSGRDTELSCASCHLRSLRVTFAVAPTCRTQSCSTTSSASWRTVMLMCRLSWLTMRLPRSSQAPLQTDRGVSRPYTLNHSLCLFKWSESFSLAMVLGQSSLRLKGCVNILTAVIGQQTVRLKDA